MDKEGVLSPLSYLKILLIFSKILKREISAKGIACGSVKALTSTRKNYFEIYWSQNLVRGIIFWPSLGLKLRVRWRFESPRQRHVKTTTKEWKFRPQTNMGKVLNKEKKKNADIENVQCPACILNRHDM